jgi:hypothetical protein
MAVQNQEARTSQVLPMNRGMDYEVNNYGFAGFTESPQGRAVLK